MKLHVLHVYLMINWLLALPLPTVALWRQELHLFTHPYPPSTSNTLSGTVWDNKYLLKDRNVHPGRSKPSSLAEVLPKRKKSVTPSDYTFTSIPPPWTPWFPIPCCPHLSPFDRKPSVYNTWGRRWSLNLQKCWLLPGSSEGSVPKCGLHRLSQFLSSNGRAHISFFSISEKYMFLISYCRQSLGHSLVEEI